jgi:hypothetical protein
MHINVMDICRLTKKYQESDIRTDKNGRQYLYISMALAEDDGTYLDGMVPSSLLKVVMKMTPNSLFKMTGLVKTIRPQEGGQSRTLVTIATISVLMWDTRSDRAKYTPAQQNEISYPQPAPQKQSYVTDLSSLFG